MFMSRVTAPPAISEGHHVTNWSRDHGDTSVSNGILLCWYHHDSVHQHMIEIRWTRSGWVFERDGSGSTAARPMPGLRNGRERNDPAPGPLGLRHDITPDTARPYCRDRPPGPPPDADRRPPRRSHAAAAR